MPFIFISDRDLKHHEDTGHGFCVICECCIGCDCCVCGKEDSDDEDTHEDTKEEDTDDNTCENCCEHIHYTVGNAHNWKKLLLCEKCKLEGVSDTRPEDEDKDKVEEECESDDSWEPECCKCGTTTDQKGMGGVEHREDLCEWMCGRCYEYATRKEEF